MHSFQVPRYLGLKSVKEKGGRFQLQLGYTSRLSRTLTVDGLGLDLIKACLKPQKAKPLARKLRRPVREVASAMSQLEKAGILKKITKKAPERLKRYDRHLLFYSLAGKDALECQRALSKARVALIGMGGIGNWTALNLIGSGFKELRLIDFDTIEMTNLTRQVLFTEADLGKPKTAVAGAVLQPKNSQTLVNAVTAKVNGAAEVLAMLKGVDFVILSADRPAQVHDWVDEACAELSIPYLNIGYKDGIGVVGPMTVHGETNCYQCFKQKPGKSTKPEQPLIAEFEARYQAPSFGPLNAMVSTIGALEIVKYFTGVGQLRSFSVELNVDPLTLAISETHYPKDAKCWQCSKRRAKRR